MLTCAQSRTYRHYNGSCSLVYNHCTYLPHSQLLVGCQECSAQIARWRSQTIIYQTQQQCDRRIVACIAMQKAEQSCARWLQQVADRRRLLQVIKQAAAQRGVTKWLACAVGQWCRNWLHKSLGGRMSMRCSVQDGRQHASSHSKHSIRALNRADSSLFREMAQVSRSSTRIR